MQVWILLCLHFCKSASPALLLTSIALLNLWILLTTLLLLLCLTQFTLVWIFVCFFLFLIQSFPCPLTMFETLKFLLVSVKVDDHNSHLTNHLETGAAFLPHPNHFYTSFFFFFLGIHYVCFWNGLEQIFCSLNHFDFMLSQDTKIKWEIFVSKKKLVISLQV